MNELQDRLDTERGREWLRRAAWSLLALALLAFVVRGGSTPADPYLVDGDATAAATVPGAGSAGSAGEDGTGRRPLAGFDEIAFTVTDPKGAMATWCAMLAATDDQRALGLMLQEDLRGYDGMVFRYDELVDGGFWMKNTIIPLAVAFFDAEGDFVSAQGMDPCPPEADQCPVYRPEAPYRFAIEVERGGLGALGIGPGSKVTLGGTPCP